MAKDRSGQSMLVNMDLTVADLESFGMWLTIYATTHDQEETTPKRNALQILMSNARASKLPPKKTGQKNNYMAVFNGLVDIFEDQKAKFRPNALTAGTQFIETIWQILWKV